MKYQVSMSVAAKRDIMYATDHIDFVLKNPSAADRLLDEIESKYETLATFPESFPIVNDPFLSYFGIRFIPIENYLLLYTVFEDSSLVGIVRFLYAKRNWKAIFAEDLNADYFSFDDEKR